MQKHKKRLSSPIQKPSQRAAKFAKPKKSAKKSQVQSPTPNAELKPRIHYRAENPQKKILLLKTHHKNSGKISVDRETSPLSSLTIPGCNEVVYKGCITSKVWNCISCTWQYLHNGTLLRSLAKPPVSFHVTMEAVSNAAVQYGF